MKSYVEMDLARLADQTKRVMQQLDLTDRKQRALYKKLESSYNALVRAIAPKH